MALQYQREDGCRAWLAYARCSPRTVIDLVAQWGSAEAVYDQTLRDRGECLRSVMRPAAVQRLLEQARPDAMHEMMVLLRDNGIRVVWHEDYLYPDALRSIQDPPALLFARGDLSCVNGRCLTIVGSRNASPRGTAACEQLSESLARQGVTIVSGLAPGIDTAAHTGSVKARAPGIGIMACGLEQDYPSRSRGLKQDLLRCGGLLLSEYPPGVRVFKGSFPRRNRILSGISRGVVLMEARIRSGSMTTVQHALDQGREVFAWPGEAGSDWSEGAHQLLREGARYFVTAEDILEDLGWAVDRAVSPAEKSVLPQLSPPMHQVLTALHKGEKSMDELAHETGLDISALSTALTLLQMYGLVRALPGKIYCIV